MFNPWRLMEKREIVFGREYVKVLEDELLMAVVFGYKEPLEVRMLELGVGVEDLRVLMKLMEIPWELRIEYNGNLSIFNL